MENREENKERESGKRTDGLVHIYCGDGKGKTTCGMGLCTRAAGYGYRVLIYQFMIFLEYYRLQEAEKKW